ncbi:MAG TPA: hypothetical protein ENF21_11015 [Bacteroidetes bacterium]|nr:hypothetical protein [Bacteroidota bacterium]
MLEHTNIHTGSSAKSSYHIVNRELNVLFGVTLLVCLLGMLTYGENIVIRDHAVSHFGRLYTRRGDPNYLSLLIFALGMTASSMICFHISRHLGKPLHQLFFRLCGAGYILLIVPCDLYNPVHTLGGTLVVGSLWFFTVFNLHDLYHLIPRVRFFLYQSILQGTVLPYAFLYAIGSPDKQLAQKFALAGLILILKAAMIEQKKREERLNRQ